MHNGKRGAIVQWLAAVSALVLISIVAGYLTDHLMMKSLEKSDNQPDIKAFREAFFSSYNEKDFSGMYSINAGSQFKNICSREVFVSEMDKLYLILGKELETALVSCDWKWRKSSMSGSAGAAETFNAELAYAVRHEKADAIHIFSLVKEEGVLRFSDYRTRRGVPKEISKRWPSGR